jgi:alpha-L-fucosidase
MDAIDKYDPDMFYTDGNSPEPFSGTHSGSGFKCDAARRVVAHYYNRSLAKHGKVDTLALIKFQQGNPAVGMTYEVNIPNKIMTGQPWIGENPIGDWYYGPGYTYNAVNLVRSLLEYASRGGNYACAVPVDPEGGMEPECVAMLKDMGEWMRTNGEGIYGSHAWSQWGEGSVVMPNGPLNQHQVNTPYTAKDIRFTQKQGNLYAWLMAWPQDGKVLVTALPESKGKVSQVQLLGGKGKLKFKQTAEGLEVELPKSAPGKFAWGLKISGDGIAGN